MFPRINLNKKNIQYFIIIVCSYSKCTTYIFSRREIFYKRNTIPRHFLYLFTSYACLSRALIWMWFLRRNGMKFSAARAAYATIAPAKSSLRGKKGPPLTLEHVGTFSFLNRQRSGHTFFFLTTSCCSFCNGGGFWRCGETLSAL